jgi:hypothetical protein
MKNEIRPLSLSEIMHLNPGALINGFIHENNLWRIGTGWRLQELDKHPRRKDLLVCHPISEHKVCWRQRLRPYARELNQSRIYSPPFDVVKSIFAGGQSSTVKVGLNVKLPVGMYLGHILRVEGVTLVNVLLFEGYDVWL